MTSWVALLRAVNVGGTGRLPMSDLRAIGEAAGFEAVRTYIASGNLVFRSPRSDADVKSDLEARVSAYAGKSVGVLIRSGAEMSGAAKRNPFPSAPASRVLVIFLDSLAAPAVLDGVTGAVAGEEIRFGLREIYVHYPNGAGSSKLRIPAAASGTARNINTVTKLAEMALA